MALNVGQLYTELSIDTTRHRQGLTQARGDLGTFEDAYRRSAQVAQRAIDEQVQGYARLRQAAEQAASEAGEAGRRRVAAADAAADAERALDAARSGGGANGIARAEERVLRARQEAAQAADESARALARLEAASRDAAQAANRIDFERVDREARRAGEATHDIEIDPGLIAAAAAAAAAIARIGDGAGEAGDRAGNDLGDGMSRGMGGKLAGLTSMGGPIAMALGGVAALGLGAGAILAGAIQDGMAQEADLAVIQAQLGTSDVVMRTIGQAAAQSYQSGWGESITENAQVVRDAIESGLLSGEELAPDMTATLNRVQTVAKVTEEESAAITRAAGQMVKTGIAATADEALDLLVKAQQSGLNVADDMMDTSTEYGTQFRQVGLSGAEAFGLMNQAVKNGARDADTAADAIKEFAIRSIDGSTGAADAYKALGLSAEDMTSQIAQGGEGARDGMQLIFEKMNQLEDPVKRNAVAVGLFGTKAEDLGQAMFNMNLDTAVREFGEVAGAADNAGNIIQNTTAAKMEQAQRSIEVSMTGVKTSLAEAFGPQLQKVADWVSTHQPEIVGFFGDLADGAFACLEGISSFVSGSLRYFATMTEASGEMFGGVLDSLGGFSEGLGSVLKHIPGMQSTGEALEGIGSAMQGYQDKTAGAADRMRGWADTIDTTVTPAIAQMREQVRNSTQAAEDSALMFRALGEGVEAVPTEHGITINSNTPEMQARLADLGLATRELPDGTFEVFANTAAGQQILENFIAKNDGRALNMYVDVQARVRSAVDAHGANSIEAWAAATNGTVQANGSVRIPAYADGKMPDQAVIQRPVPGRGLIQWAEPETEGEAFIPLAPSKRARSLRILAETAARMGMQVIPREHTKVFHGDPDSLDDRSDPAGWRRFLGGDYTGAMGKWAGGEDSALVDVLFGTRAMLADGDYDGSLAKYGVHEDHPLVDALLNVHGMAVRKFAEGGITDQSRNAAEAFAKAQDDLPYTYGGASGSAWDCSGIHSGIYNQLTGKDVRFTTDSDFESYGFKRGYDPGGYNIGTNGKSGEQGHMAGDLFGVNVESASGKGVQYGSPALGAQDFEQVWHLPGAGRGGNPSSDEIGALEAQLADARTAEMGATTDADRRAAAAKVADLEAQIAALKASAASGGGDDSAGAQRVYVTNWPSGMGGSSSSSSSPSSSSGSAGSAPAAAATEETSGPHDISTVGGRGSLYRALTAKFFARGGFGGVGTSGESHDAEIASAGSWRIFAEPESGGEAYIPLSPDPAQRERSLAIWRQTGQRLGAFAAGTAAAALTGWDAEGNFVGFSTGGQGIPGLDKALEALAEKLQPAPAVNIEHAEINDPEQFVKDSATNDLADRFPFLQANI